LGGGANLGEGGPTGRAEALEAGELRLDGDAGGASALDQATAVGDDGSRGGLGGITAGGYGGRPRSAQLGGIGVEAEADLAAALFDERRKPIREAGRQRISRP